MNHRSWIAISGFVWLVIGALLLFKGLRLITDATLLDNALCYRLKGVFGSPQQSGTALIAGALLVGFFKGRFVLGKTVRRVSMHILSLPLPIRFISVYAPSYWILIASMMGIGLVFRFLPIPLDARGFIDTAIGSALMNGAVLYFRAARGALRV